MKKVTVFIVVFLTNIISSQEVVFEYSQKIDRKIDDLNIIYEQKLINDLSLTRVKNINDIKQIENFAEFDYAKQNDSIVNYVHKYAENPRYVRIPQDIIFKSYAEEFILTSTVDNVKENHKIIKDDLDIFKWDLIEEESDTLILNFKCKKAKTKFRGREYIAYYSNEIANFGGPWKFDGLPGFILKIYSLDGFLSIEPISIRVDNNNQTVKIINPFENKRFIYFNDLKNVILKEEQEHFKRAKSSNPYLTSIKKGGSFNTIEDIGLNYERKYE